MVRVSTWLCRVPVIKFRAGGSGSATPASAAASHTSLPGAASPAVPRAPAAPQTAQPAAAMSTIPDIDLPARYRRQPLSEDEINHINGGGVV